MIARAAAIFRVDEVVVYDADDDARGAGDFLGRVLSYLETPQYLRKYLIPVHKDLRRVGILPPLDAPHQPREHEWLPYREGVGVADGEERWTSEVDIGLKRRCTIEKLVEKGNRVTVRLPEEQPSSKGELRGVVVEPDEPRRRGGMYWGYRVRRASSLSDAIVGCPWEQGYTLTLGMSEHGQPLSQVASDLNEGSQHVLVAFGGPDGLERAARRDNRLHVKDPECLFDYYVDAAPWQGSRTIRTEEAIFVCLSSLRSLVSL